MLLLKAAGSKGQDHQDLRCPRSGRANHRDLVAFLTCLAATLAVALWVPIIHPCWSGSMSVLVEGAAEPVPSADIQLRDPLRIGNRFG